MRWPLILLALSAPLAASFAPADSSEPPRPPAHALCSGDTTAPTHPAILPGYGSGGFPVRTDVPAAQAFFDNGMQLASAFAHRAAIAAFAESARLDAACAMCAWGEAWSAGPTINYPIDPVEARRLARRAADAARLAAGGPAREVALTTALLLRYPANEKANGNLAFAKAMDRVARNYPDDDAIQVLAADAWLIASEKEDYTLRSVALLEPVLARYPDYTPAIHFYIHATELAGIAERAEPYADRLPALAPAASHLIHMPSHTYYHIGRYQDAVDANMRAVAIGIANAKRLGLPQPDGVWDLPYHAHNVRYGVGAALISGDAKSALALSAPLVARAATAKGGDRSPYIQMVAGTAYFALGHFADPASVLAAPPPAKDLSYAAAYWHYARGEAQARRGDAAAVRAEAAAMLTPQGKLSWDDNSLPAARTIDIARLVLQGRAATLDGDYPAALAAFRHAARLQEGEEYSVLTDPPAFWYPVRRDIAATLLAMGKPREARTETEAVLEMMPRDPETEKLRARIAMLQSSRIIVARR